MLPWVTISEGDVTQTELLRGLSPALVVVVVSSPSENQSVFTHYTAD